MLNLFETIGIAIIDLILVFIAVIEIIDCINTNNKIKKIQKEINELISELEFKYSLRREYGKQKDKRI